MLYSKTLFVALTAFATISAAMPAGSELFERQVDNRSCSSERKESDLCTGRRLRMMNSFHNCKNTGGKCCATNKDGTGGIDVNQGIGREDCGYCYSGRCTGSKAVIAGGRIIDSVEDIGVAFSIA